MSPSAIPMDGTTSSSSHPASPSSPAQFYDLIVIGFGPAALSIAVALHDSGLQRRVLFLERQAQFAWHSGMLLPTAKMQISFVKDLATFRDPRSQFTFLNYLHQKERLAQFCNLNTFLPHREEFNDYLSWAASHFDEQVRYGCETTSVSPVEDYSGDVKAWNVSAKDVATGEQLAFEAKDVVIAVGGYPKLPRSLSSFGQKVIHSSQYLKVVPALLATRGKKTRVAVVGGGQSAAEIFEDLMERYPQVSATLYTSQAALKPSDDSPFVNEIFDPTQVNTFYDLSPSARQHALTANRATNYSVVRLELLERLYEKMYKQRLHEPDERRWQHRIIGGRELVGVQALSESSDRSENGGQNQSLRLRLRDTSAGVGKRSKQGMGDIYDGNGVRSGAADADVDADADNDDDADGCCEEADVDLVITGTGYVRDAHEALLEPCRALFENGPSDVGRDYRLRLRNGSDGLRGPGIWLQGCCEQSHGLSDSLLSILAVRGGEIVESVFGKKRGIKGLRNGVGAS